MEDLHGQRHDIFWEEDVGGGSRLVNESRLSSLRNPTTTIAPEEEEEEYFVFLPSSSFWRVFVVVWVSSLAS